MRKAIGTSIRSANSTLRRLEHHQQQINPLRNQGSLDADERDEGMYDMNDVDTIFNETDDIRAGEDDEDEDDAEDEDDDEGGNGRDNEDSDEELENLAINEELDDGDEG